MSEFFCKKKKLLIVIFAIAIAVLVVPVITAGGYTFLCEDDFSFENGAKDLIRDYGNIYVGAFHRMVSYYNSNQGTYLFNYLMSALRIYSRAGLPGFHIFMILSIALFCLTLGNLVRVIVKDWAGTLAVSISLAVLIFSMQYTQMGKEIFFWYTGVLYMLLIFILSFTSLTLSIRNIQTGKLSYAIWGMIIGFFASGGSLGITSANCGWLLAVLILSFPWDSKKTKGFFLPFAGAFVGALINAVAPGNFNRLGDVKLSVWDGFVCTYKACISDAKIMTSSRVFWGTIVFCFFMCIMLKVRILPKNITVMQLVICLVGAELVKYFCMFPVAFPNSWSDMGEFSMRTFSSYEVESKIMNIFIVMVLAQFVVESFAKVGEIVSAALLALAVVFLFVSYPATKSELKAGLSYAVINDFRTGAIQETYLAREYILSSLEMAEDGTDCILYVPSFKRAETMYGMGLGVDCEWIVNRSAAGLYDLHTVTIIYQE